MKCYFAPYEGSEPFLFFSYCHEDAAQAYAIIERLVLHGVLVWYDSGIHAGDEWPEAVAKHLADSKACLALISEQASASHNCKNELSFAVSRNIPIVSVVLHDFRMPIGLQLQLEISRYLKLWEFSEVEAFYRELLASPHIQACSEENTSPDLEALSAWRDRVKTYLQASQTASADYSGINLWFQNEAHTDSSEEKCRNTEKEKGKDSSEKKEKDSSEEKEKDSSEEKEKDDGGAARKHADAPPETESETDDDPTIVEDEDEPTELKNTRAKHTALLIRVFTGEVFTLDRYEHRIGRSETKADLVLENNPEISRAHADLIQYHGKFMICDLGSTHGTTVNARHLLPNVRVELNEAEIITLADETFLFASSETAAWIRSRKRVSWLRSTLTGEVQMLTPAGLLLDRHHPWDNGVLADKHISRENNAAIRYEEDTFCLYDIASRNGTRLNGRQLEKGERAVLKAGDRISIVNTNFEFDELLL